MLVACVEGDVFFPSLRSANWNVGETKRCGIASDTSMKPDPGRDLLLCGDTTRLAWSQTWLRADIRKQIYVAAHELRINFHSPGHGGGRAQPPLWQCKRTWESIECE